MLNTEMKQDVFATAVPADQPTYEERPWGAFWSLDRGVKHQVKRIRVNAGGKLSLQYHDHRAERWVVVEGVATVTLNDTTFDAHPGQIIEIPLGAVHRLANLTDEPTVIVEVQLGHYLGEDDIVRLEDVYARS